MSFVGREREMARLAHAVECACDGRGGGVWFVTGEPGIGKSRLAEEAVRLGREHGMRTFWGRCWEAGGAPAYWPWIQILRGLLRTGAPGQHDAYQPVLAQILPEQATETDVSGLGPEQARFQLMDAVARVLHGSAADCPLLVVLEDLHVADSSTVLLLDFLSGTSRNHPLLILGTLRDTEAGETEVGVRLLRIAQGQQRIALHGLTRAQVAEFVKSRDATLDEPFIEALHRTTEGHPLFMVEVARLWQSRGPSGGDGHLVVPTSVRNAIDERLQKLSGECLELLRRGAVVGREFDVGLLEVAFEDQPMGYERACREASDAAALIEIGHERYRFSHYLTREAVYEATSKADRVGSHERVARALSSWDEAGAEPSWSEVAHHLIAAGPTSAREAALASRKAGAQALAQLAFDVAVRAYEQAEKCLSATSGHSETESIELMLELGHAQIRAGRMRHGKATCRKAAERARELGDAELFARAALEHGTALLFVQVDAELVALLQESLQILDDEDSPVRARVSARLAAALQPSPTPEEPIAIAREAIEMARRLDDPETLLYTLRTGGSALVDLAAPEERIVLDREHVALAERLGNRVEALRGSTRSVLDYLELGRLDDAFRSMRACDRITGALGHPIYRWRSVAFHAMRALWRGDLDEACEMAERSRALGEKGGDPNAIVVFAMQMARVARYRGDFEAAEQHFDALGRNWGHSETGRLLADATIATEYALTGRPELAARRFRREMIEHPLMMIDRTLKLGLARLCALVDERQLAELLYKQLTPLRENLVTGGMSGLTIDGPISGGLAHLARYLEEHDDANAHFRHAIRKARRTGGRPCYAQLACEYADFLMAKGGAEQQQEALKLASEARQIAEELSMKAVLAESTALLESLATSHLQVAPKLPVPPTAVVTMHRAGELWLVRSEGAEFHLRNTKGVRILAELISHPGREFHVLELGGGPETTTEMIDRGDSGEVLDEQARRAYQQRAKELREELEEAERWNDRGRADRARQELEFLERELAGAMGLGGRQRRTGAASERARINVQRRIRDAIRRIESQHPDLAKHLDWAVRTGTFCVYRGHPPPR